MIPIIKINNNNFKKQDTSSQSVTVYLQAIDGAPADLDGRGTIPSIGFVAYVNVTFPNSHQMVSYLHDSLTCTTYRINEPVDYGIWLIGYVKYGSFVFSQPGHLYEIIIGGVAGAGAIFRLDDVTWNGGPLPY